MSALMCREQLIADGAARDGTLKGSISLTEPKQDKPQELVHSRPCVREERLTGKEELRSSAQGRRGPDRRVRRMTLHSERQCQECKSGAPRLTTAWFPRTYIQRCSNSSFENNMSITLEDDGVQPACWAIELLVHWQKFP